MNNLNLVPKNMRCFIIPAAVATSLWFACAAAAQTNLPPTIIEQCEAQTGTVIVKGFSQVGTMPLGNGTIAVRCKQTADVGHDQKLDGIMVVLHDDGAAGALAVRRALVVDYDELDSLIGGLDYLGKITYDATPLDGFDASYTTRSGLRFSAHSERRQGGIQMFIQFGDAPKIPLTSEQLTRLRDLIAQAKSSLDAIK
jgi:hypothetical protein